MVKRLLLSPPIDNDVNAPCTALLHVGSNGGFRRYYRLAFEWPRRCLSLGIHGHLRCPDKTLIATTGAWVTDGAGCCMIACNLHPQS